MNEQTLSVPTCPHYIAIDHVAIAVHDLQEAIQFYSGTLGFKLVAERHVSGAHSGMISAEMEHAGITFVLCQGTEQESQVSLLIEHYGAGVAHIALSVDDVEQAVERLGKRGMQFETSIITSPGLTQVFSKRDPNSGMSFELIKRTTNCRFSQENIQNLFEQLEKSKAY